MNKTTFICKQVVEDSLGIIDVYCEETNKSYFLILLHHKILVNSRIEISDYLEIQKEHNCYILPTNESILKYEKKNEENLMENPIINKFSLSSPSQIIWVWELFEQLILKFGGYFGDLFNILLVKLFEGKEIRVDFKFYTLSEILLDEKRNDDNIITSFPRFKFLPKQNSSCIVGLISTDGRSFLFSDMTASFVLICENNCLKPQDLNSIWMIDNYEIVEEKINKNCQKFILYFKYENSKCLARGSTMKNHIFSLSQHRKYNILYVKDKSRIGINDYPSPSLTGFIFGEYIMNINGENIPLTKKVVVEFRNEALRYYPSLYLGKFYIIDCKYTSDSSTFK